MPNQNFLSLTGALQIATANKTALASSVLHLFTYSPTFTPSVTTPKSDYEANECNFDGYAPKTITAFEDPVLLGSGYAVFGPPQIFRWEFDTEGIGNAVGGWFLVTSGGVLRDVGVFDPPIPCQGEGQAVIVTPIEVTPAQ